MKAILVTCPHCGARVHVAGLSDEVRCDYCNTSSRVQRRTRLWQTALPPPPAAPHRPIKIAVQARSGAVIAIVLFSILIPIGLSVGIALFIRGAVKHATSYSQSASSSSNTVRSATSRTDARRSQDDDGLQWQGTDGALFVDVDRDGTVDVIGRGRKIQDGDVVYAIALDGKTGAKKWQSAPLGKYDQTYQARLAVGAASAVADGLVLFASMRGEVRAMRVADGTTAWTAQLDERVIAFCDGGSAAVIAVGADDVERPLRRSDGKPATAADATISDALVKSLGGADKKTKPGPPKRRGTVTCSQLPTDAELRSSRVRNSSNDYELGRKHGLSVRAGSAVFSGPGGRVLAGTRERGTHIPQLVGLDDKDGARWKIAIPADPLGSAESGPEAVTVGDKHACATYHVESSAKPPHLACFALADGARAWDHLIEEGHSLRMLHLDANALYAADSGRIELRDIANGNVRWSYP